MAVLVSCDWLCRRARLSLEVSLLMSKKRRRFVIFGINFLTFLAIFTKELLIS